MAAICGIAISFKVKHFHSVDPLKCSEEEDWLSLSNGTIYIDPGIKKKHGGISCSITFFDRIDDFGNKDLKTLYFSNETKLPLLIYKLFLGETFQRSWQF
jgi:hypothetical protein